MMSKDPELKFVPLATKTCDKCAHFDICIIYKEVKERIEMIAHEFNWKHGESFIKPYGDEHFKEWHLNPKDLAKICRIYIPKLGLEPFKAYENLKPTEGDDTHTE